MNEFGGDYDKIFTVTGSLGEEYGEYLGKSVGAVVYTFNNVGRDIYPFWKLVQLGVLDKYDLVCKLHGKLSKHRQDGSEWRRNSIRILCGTETTIKNIEEYFVRQKAKETCFVAPVLEQTLLRTEAKHWLGNQYWLHKLSLRLGHELSVEDVINTTVMSGSFYWLNRAGINRYRSLPISDEDWLESEARKGPNNIDGALEHFVERSLLLSEPFNVNGSSVCTFVDLTGRLCWFEPSLISEESNYAGQEIEKFQRIDKRSELIVRANQFGRQRENSELCSCYDVAVKSNGETIVSGYVLDLVQPARRFLVSIMVDNSIVASQESVMDCGFQPVPDITDGKYGFNFRLKGVFEKERIKIIFGDSLIPIPSESRYNIDQVNDLLLLQAVQYRSFAFPEYLRRIPDNFPQFYDNSMTPHRQSIDRFKSWRARERRPELPAGEGVIHVFVVNNPIAEVAANRTIEYLGLKRSDVIILVHRLNCTSAMLSGFTQISTNLPDIETLTGSESLMSVMNFCNRLLDVLAGRLFHFYAHHYNAVFSYVLGMHPACISTNLIEEGNLSSVPTWEAEYATKTLQYASTANLINRSSPLDAANSIVARVGSTEFDLFSHGMIAEIFPDASLIDASELMFDRCFSSVEEYFHTRNYFPLLAFKRYYFWHPKMLNEHHLYTVSKAFCGMAGSEKLFHPSARETVLKDAYKDKLGPVKTLVLLPSSGGYPFHLPKITPCDSKFAPIFSGNTSSDKTYIILHPSDRISDATRSAALEKLSLYPVGKLPNLIDLTEILGDSPVTELAATCFDYVVHYGSSLSLLLSQYKSKTQEILYGKFS